MEPPRLKSKIWVQAQLRICDQSNMPAFVINRGDPDGGSILLKINRLGSGCEVLARRFDGEGNRVWMVVAGGAADGPEQHREMEQKADGYIARELDIDPDLWVLEIEDPDGRYELGEPLIRD